MDNIAVIVGLFDSNRNRILNRGIQVGELRDQGEAGFVVASDNGLPENAYRVKADVTLDSSQRDQLGDRALVRAYIVNAAVQGLFPILMKLIGPRAIRYSFHICFPKIWVRETPPIRAASNPLPSVISKLIQASVAREMNMKGTFKFLLTVSAASFAACGGESSPGVQEITTVQVDSIAPNVSFTPDVLDLPEEVKETVSLRAVDNTAVISGPTVECYSGLEYQQGTIITPSVDTEIRAECVASATDAAGNTGTATLYVTVRPQVKSDQQKMGN